VSNPAYRLIKSLIPGPYTFILPASRLKQLPKSLFSKRKAVGIRVPDNTISQMLIRELGHPILGASATGPEGEILHDPEVIGKMYGNRVDLILDAGYGKLEVSTILDLTDDRPVVVREGAGDISMLLMNQ
jgi:tRNA threonylcarbamoyl adenosine modification protein (Sua5/YciO/YrdC/YwlC family)